MQKHFFRLVVLICVWIGMVACGNEPVSIQTRTSALKVFAGLKSSQLKVVRSRKARSRRLVVGEKVLLRVALRPTQRLVQKQFTLVWKSEFRPRQFRRRTRAQAKTLCRVVVNLGRLRSRTRNVPQQCQVSFAQPGRYRVSVSAVLPDGQIYEFDDIILEPTFPRPPFVNCRVTPLCNEKNPQLRSECRTRIFRMGRNSQSQTIFCKGRECEVTCDIKNPNELDDIRLYITSMTREGTPLPCPEESFATLAPNETCGTMSFRLSCGVENTQTIKILMEDPPQAYTHRLNCISIEREL